MQVAVVEAWLVQRPEEEEAEAGSHSADARSKGGGNTVVRGDCAELSTGTSSDVAANLCGVGSAASRSG